VVKEPFYIRQMTAKVAHKVMAQMGVRFNDFGTFARANRLERGEQAQAQSQSQTAPV
jgi:nucleoid DNA-binding protein